MTHFKKFGLGLLIIGALFLTGCSAKEENIEGSLEEIMDKLYEGISEDELPMGLSNVEITSENVEGYLGTSDIEFESALASESMVGSIAHSIILVRAKENQDIEALKKQIEDSINPNKWVCVTAENVVVKNKGDLILVIMTNELAPKIEENFDKLS